MGAKATRPWMSERYRSQLTWSVIFLAVAALAPLPLSSMYERSLISDQLVAVSLPRASALAAEGAGVTLATSLSQVEGSSTTIVSCVIWTSTEDRPVPLRVSPPPLRPVAETCAPNARWVNMSVQPGQVGSTPWPFIVSL